MSNVHLEAQKKRAYDEFYTLMSDFVKIVDMHKCKLIDKVVYCNRDIALINGKHKYKRIFVKQRRGYCDKN